MTPFLQALNVGTMAAWLTVSGASTVACLVKVDYILPAKNDRSDLKIALADVFDMDTQIAGEPAAGSAAPDEPSAEPQLAEPTPVEPVPEIPEISPLEPLPEVPDLPQPKPDSLQTERPKEMTRTEEAPKPRRKQGPPAAQPGKTGGANGTTGTGGGTGNGPSSGNGSAIAGAERLSKGRTPKPPYPSTCQRANQEGRVGITFTVDEQGNVVSARVSSATPYPEMNQAALNGVYRWKFPPGTRVTATKAIVFQLH
ncbi:energy transducer TonB [Luteolibacter sp. LG18]|uniref:energy transducer TonB n=1 Tax=Luteolibacter sp. LG18 TaxID=2819286 RepID=UPI0030C7627C